MGAVFKSVGSILGIGGGAPKVSDAAAQDVQNAQANTNANARTALYATEGGPLGQQLQPDDVQKRTTLLGN